VKLHKEISTKTFVIEKISVILQSDLLSEFEKTGMFFWGKASCELACTRKTLIKRSQFIN